MDENLTCPGCGEPISPDPATRGLCPRCLLRAAGEQGEAAPGRSSTRRPRVRRGWMAPQPAELAAVFPQLEVLELLGQGGMGAVYRVRQRSLDRAVALKLIPRDLSGDAEFVARFEQEARTLGRLNHPNLVAVYDFGQAGPYCYFVMEYVDGCNLREAIHAGRLTAAEALHVAIQVCEALTYAHEQGVVHRDVKPENILLENGLPLVPVEGPERGEPPLRGKAKITDFGLARLAPGAEESALTTDGQVLGTPLYMAPEQIERPREIDHRADIYSFGVVLYEMLTGGLPLGRFAPVSKSGVDPRLDPIVFRCLEKEPQRRYQRAADLAADLRAVLSSPPAETDLVPLEPIADRGGRRRAFRVRTQVIPWVLVLVLLAWILFPAREPPAPTEEPAPAAQQAKMDVGPTPARPAGSAAPEPKARSPSEARRGPPAEEWDPIRYPVELSNVRLLGDASSRVLRIEYRFRTGFPSPGSRYFWVVESSSGATESWEVRWPNLARDGTLRSSVLSGGLDKGPIETYLEVQELGFHAGRRRVSNIVRIGE